MQNLAVAWLRQYSCSLLIIGLSALTMGGCPPTTGPGTDPPPGQDLVEVTIVGQGNVDQNTDGNLVTLSADPDVGWIFDGWSGVVLEDQDQTPLTVDARVVTSITANFIEDDTPPSPADADGDGVRDTLDTCPDTPRGTLVDASGCPAGPEELDSDNDGVNDADDDCPRTPSTVNVDERGCPISVPGTADDDGDDVPNDIDQCEDTADGADVDANGCAESQLDTDGDNVTDDLDDCPGTPERTVVLPNGCPAGGGGGGGGGGGPPPPNCGNGAIDAPEECDEGGETPLCNSNCTTSRCGDRILNVHSLEQCDDGNRVAGDGCAANCQSEISNERCSDPIAVGDGTLAFSNLGATTDGPDEPSTCTFFARSNVESDIWYCYTASCSGTATVSLCGSSFDTKLAVYDGCNCPTTAPLECSDDDCGTGVENVQSRVTVSVTQGQQYLLRVGSFLRPGEAFDAQGDGRLTIGCNVDACASGSGDCSTPSPTGAPGCGDATCCAATCQLDRFCCDVTWDDTCAGEAEGVCDGNFQACGPSAGACGIPSATPGCSTTSCCNTVCSVDPFCCLSAWDGTCVDEAEAMCFLTCGPGAGDCFSAHVAPGCDAESCCASVCADDAYCCDTEWDQVCADLANTRCR